MSEHKERISDEQLKQQLIAGSIQSEQYKFPTETVDLPSKGWFYPEDNPLSSGTIELKYPTAKEEDILTSANLIKNGTVIDKFLKSIIVSPVKYNDLLIGDKNAIMVAARILAYGADYPFELTCPACGAKQTDLSINLSELENKNTPTDAPRGSRAFEMKLPASERTIGFNLMTHGDERKVEHIIEGQKKLTRKTGVDPELTSRFKVVLNSIDGNTEQSEIDKFVDNEFLSRDAQAFRKHIKDLTPDISMTFDFVCDECGHEERVMDFPITSNFFWPKS